MRPTADNVSSLLKQYFRNVGLILNGHNLTDVADRVVTVNRANKGMTIVAVSANAQFVELDDSADWDNPESFIETLKHFPATRLDQSEVVETFYKAYATAEEAAFDLLTFWTKDYWDWALEGYERSPERDLDDPMSAEERAEYER